MSSSEEAVAPVQGGGIQAAEPAPAGRAFDRRWRAIQEQVLSTTAYFVVGIILMSLRFHPHRMHFIQFLPIMIAPTAITMLLQLWLIWSYAKIRQDLQTQVKWAIVSGIVWLFFSFAIDIPRSAPPILNNAVTSIGAIGLSIMLTFVGVTIARIVREPKILLPICIIAGVIDVLGAMTHVGFTHHMIAQHPQVVSKVSVHLPSVTGLPTGQLGPADVLFLGFFFAVVLHHRMNSRATFALLYLLLTGAMVGVVYGFLPPIAALAPMGFAVIVANWKFFSFTREEKFAMLYAGLISIAAAVGFFLYVNAQVFHQGRPSPDPSATHSPTPHAQ